MKKIIKYSLYGLIYLFIIFLFAVMFIVTAKADLVKPNNGIEPYQVVKIQLRSLKKNDNPTKDSGIKQTWEFAHPDNKKNTGPLDRFKTMIKGKSYKMLLDHLDHKFVKIVVKNKKDLFTFDRFVDRIQNRKIHELKIAENFDEFIGENVEDESISLEDTSTLLDSYVESVDTELDKDRIKVDMRKLLTEAQALEIV